MPDLIERLESMPPERRSYTLRTLPEHLEESGAISRLHSLLRERVCTEHSSYERRRKRGLISRLLPQRRLLVTRVLCDNVWYAAQERQGNTSGFLADVARGWRLAEFSSGNEIKTGGRGRSIALEARYALISASINNLGANIPAEFLSRLVETGVWSTTQGLTYARQIPTLHQRAVALAVIAGHLGEGAKGEVLRQALDAVLAIKDESRRADALGNISAYLPPSLLQQAVAVARAISNEVDRVRGLSCVALHLREPLKSEVLRETSAAAQELKREQDKFKALLTLVPFQTDVDKQESLWRILDKVAASSDGFWQFEMIEGAAKHLSESLLIKAQGVARGIREEPYRTKALLVLTSAVAQYGRGNEALEQVKEAENSPGCGRAQAQALGLVTPHLNREQMRRAVKLMRRLYAEEDRAEAIAGMGPFLPRDLFAEVFAAAKAMKNVEHLGVALRGLAPKLPEPQKGELLNRVLQELIQKPDSKSSLIEVASKLSPHLNQDLLRLVLPEIRKLDDGLQIIKTISALAAKLALAQKAEVTPLLLNYAHLLTNERERSEAYANITGLVAEVAGIDEALILAQTIEQPDRRAEALVCILPSLPAHRRDKVLSATLAQWGGELNSGLEAQLPAGMELIAPYLGEALWPVGVKVAANKSWESNRGGMLAGLARHATSLPLLRLVLDAVNEIKDERVRSAALVSIAPRLAHLGRPAEALEMAQSMTDRLNKLSALEEIIPYLPKSLLPQMLPLIEEFSFEGSRWSAYAVLAPRLAELGDLDTALRVMLSINGYQRRALAAARMAKHARPPMREKLIEHALAIVRNAQRELEESEDWWQTEVLTCLAPYLSGEMLIEAFTMASEIEKPNERFAPLAALSSQLAQLPPLTVHQLWSQALHRSAARSRTNLLSDLRAFAPFIDLLGGAEVTNENVSYIYDVGQCWPA